MVDGPEPTKTDPAKADPPAKTPAQEPEAPAIPAPKPLPAGQIEVHGAPGKPFNITGLDLGPKGTVTFAGQTVETTAWYTREHDRTTMIKGVLPSDARTGEVIVTTSGRTHRGWFGQKPAGKK